MLRRFTATFFAGLTALLPMIITVALVVFIAGYIYAWFGPGSLIFNAVTFMSEALGLTSLKWVKPVMYVLSLAIVIGGIWAVGFFTRKYIGQRIGKLVELLIGKIPFINKIYSSVDQVIDLFKKKEGDSAAALSNVVLVNIANIRVLGMLSSPEPIDINGVMHFLVYLPSTPIPSSGQNLLVPCTDVQDVNISVEEMTKILISLGSLGPGILNTKAPLILPGPGAARSGATPAG